MKTETTNLLLLAIAAILFIHFFPQQWLFAKSWSWVPVAIWILSVLWNGFWSAEARRKSADIKRKIVRGNEYWNRREQLLEEYRSEAKTDSLPTEFERKWAKLENEYRDVID